MKRNISQGAGPALLVKRTVTQMLLSPDLTEVTRGGHVAWQLRDPHPISKVLDLLFISGS